MKDINPDHNMPVASVIGSTMTVWNEAGKNGVRPRNYIREFSTPGVAREWAAAHDTQARKERDSRVGRGC